MQKQTKHDSRTKQFDPEGELELMLGMGKFFKIPLKEILKTKLPTYWFMRRKFLEHLEDMAQKQANSKGK